VSSKIWYGIQKWYLKNDAWGFYVLFCLIPYFMDQANRRQKLGLVWRIRKKISQIIKDYFYLPFFLLIILWVALIESNMRDTAARWVKWMTDNRIPGNSPSDSQSYWQEPNHHMLISPQLRHSSAIRISIASYRKEEAMKQMWRKKHSRWLLKKPAAEF
jgi:hypothetical protein